VCPLEASRYMRLHLRVVMIGGAGGDLKASGDVTAGRTCTSQDCDFVL
jgi:hypothetical protein